MYKLQLHPQLADERSDTVMLDMSVFPFKAWQTWKQVTEF